MKTIMDSVKKGNIGQRWKKGKDVIWGDMRLKVSVAKKYPGREKSNRQKGKEKE
jgi:hypothetical protein